MKPAFYWIKIGMLIGFGFLAVQLSWPFGIVAVALVLPVFLFLVLLYPLPVLLGRLLGYLQCRIQLARGWAERSGR